MLRSRVIQRGVPMREEAREYRNIILREKREKEGQQKRKQKRKEKPVQIKKTKKKELLREVIVKIGLEKIDTQKRITVEMSLDNEATKLVICLEFAMKKGFKLKKIENLIYMRNVDGTLNKEGPI